MLSAQENELLTRVGPGTPMGDLMRQYWIPVLLSSELEPGDRTRRVKLLGEDLVAFRTQSGAVGLLQQFVNYYGTGGAGDVCVVALLAIVLLARPHGISGRVAA